MVQHLQWLSILGTLCLVDSWGSLWLPVPFHPGFLDIGKKIWAILRLSLTDLTSSPSRFILGSFQVRSDHCEGVPSSGLSICVCSRLQKRRWPSTVDRTFEILQCSHLPLTWVLSSIKSLSSNVLDWMSPPPWSPPRSSSIMWPQTTSTPSSCVLAS